MKWYRLREEDRQFLYSLLYATGLILFWRGIWEVSYELPILENVYFCLFVGLFILTMTGYMYREFDPFNYKSKKINRVLHDIMNISKKGEPHDLFYYDDIGGHHHKMSTKDIRKIEADMIVFEVDGHEAFIPIHRLTRIHKDGKVIWKR